MFGDLAYLPQGHMLSGVRKGGAPWLAWVRLTPPCPCDGRCWPDDLCRTSDGRDRCRHQSHAQFLGMALTTVLALPPKP